ncbi:uncharacterized protein LOC141907391 [Tubulanus polymorphus]|uniref:uncharacterized protein LOC141907391 n=1 Tax=Tubulanus polymorphus TaxID=672921 RepID=UPI003DA3ED3B
MAPKTCESVPSTASSLHESELEILMQEFPDVKCYCELCDCGRHIHHKDCQKGRQTLPKLPPGEIPLTDYQSTFHAKPQKPRSSKRPPPTPHFLPPPGDYNTNQRKDYKGHDVNEHKRPEGFQKEQKYTPPKVKFDGTTFYQQTYTPKEQEPEHYVVQKGAHRGRRKRTPGLFDDRTTNKETFKTWTPPINYRYGDLPTFTGSILYPDRTRVPKTEMQQSFPGAYAPKPEMMKMKDGNLKIEGSLDMLTTHRDTYKDIPDGAQRAERIYQKSELGIGNRGKFMGQTQQMYDFPDYTQHYPLRPDMAIPAPTTIDLRFNRKSYLETEQMNQYQGYDVAVHKRPPAAKLGDYTYEPPTVPMDGVTWQRAVYTPKDLSDAQNNRALPPRQAIRGKAGNFEKNTHYMEQFKAYKPEQRYRLGDFHEAYKYAVMPKIDKLAEVTSTTHRTYTVPQNAEIRESFKPEAKPIASKGKHDFTTIHQADYQPLKVNLCRAQVFLLQQQIKQRRAERKKAREEARKAKLDTGCHLVTATL